MAKQTKKDIKIQNENSLNEVGGLISVINYFSENELNKNGAVLAKNIVSPFRFGNKMPLQNIYEFQHRLIEQKKLQNEKIELELLWERISPLVRKEIKQEEFSTLLNYKFNMVKNNQSYETKPFYAANELVNFKALFPNDFFSKLPIVSQWCIFLKDFSDGKINQDTDQEIKIGTYTYPEKYTLLHELGILQFLDEKHNFNSLKQTQKIALLQMILGFDEKGKDSIKGILISPRLTDKNYPFKPNNINKILGDLTRIGIITTKSVKDL